MLALRLSLRQRPLSFGDRLVVWQGFENAVKDRRFDALLPFTAFLVCALKKAVWSEEYTFGQKLVTRMGFLRRAAAIGVGVGTILTASCWAQQLAPAQAADPTMAASGSTRISESTAIRSDPRTYRDVDLSRRRRLCPCGFSTRKA